MTALDTTTRADYDAAPTASERAEVVRAALGSVVAVKVYNGAGTVMGEGTMLDPWATRVSNVLTLGQIATFDVTTNGTPDANWYLRYEGNSRWFRGSFGLTGSGQEFVWSLPTWEIGQNGVIGTSTATAYKTSTEIALSASYNVAGATLTFGWTGTSPVALGAFPQGVSSPVDLSTYAYTVGATPLYTVQSAPAGVTVTGATGLLTIPATLGSGSYTAIVDLSEAAVPLGQVTGLVATGTTSSTVSLRWSPLTGATSYTVERGTSSTGPWTSLPPTTLTSYTATGLAASTAYWFRVTGTNATQTGVPSAPATATTLPASAGTGDWLARSTATGVIWAHDFSREQEVDAFRKTSQNAPDNNNITLGTHDKILTAHWTSSAPNIDTAVIPADPGVSGNGCLQIVSLGAETTAAITETDDDWKVVQTIASADFTFLRSEGTVNSGSKAGTGRQFIVMRCGQIDDTVFPTGYTWSIVNGSFNSGSFPDGHVVKLEGTTTYDGYWLVRNVTLVSPGVYDYYLQSPKWVLPPASSTKTNFKVKGIILSDSRGNRQVNITIDAANAPYFPNPGGDRAKRYILVSQINYDAGFGVIYPKDPSMADAPKGYKESFAVLNKTTNADGTATLLVERARSFPTENDMANHGAPAPFPAGSCIGQDSDGGWSRCFAAFAAPYNGKTSDDPGGIGLDPSERVTVHNEPPTGDYAAGYYGHNYYHTLPEFSTWDGKTDHWDGEEFYCQFRFKISPNRMDAGNPGGKLFFFHTEGTGCLHQIVGTAPNGTTGENVLKVFSNKGAEDFESPQGFTPSQAYLQPDDTNPAGSVAPLCKNVGNKSGCYPWPLDEWITINFYLNPGYSRDEEFPRSNQGESDGALTVLADFSPTNNGTVIEFETTIPPDFKYWPISRSTTDYAKNWTASWLNSTWTGGGLTKVLTNYVTGGRMRWQLIKRNANSTLPSGTPPIGAQMQVSMSGAWECYDASRKTTGMRMEVRRANGQVVTIYNKSDYAIMYGQGENVFSAHPPAFNSFQPTGYANIQDNLPPGGSTVWYRYDEVIFSKRPIAWPTA